MGLTLRFLSLFSGIEAASCAWKPLGWQCVAVSEIEPFPSAVLAHHYPDVPNLGDVTKITEQTIAGLGQIDLVVFGSPCQDLSVAGKRAGFSGERSGLFHTAIRIIQWARTHNGCRFALWENVPGAFSSNKGRDFAAVVSEMAGLADVDVPANGWGTEGAALGDDALLEWAVLDAQWFGVAQRRRRVFAIADFGDWSNRPPILLERDSLRGDTAPSREAGQSTAHDVAPSLTASGRGVERIGETRGQDPVVAVTCMAHGQGGAEIAGNRCPTLTCNHEAPIIAFDSRQDPVSSDQVFGALGSSSPQAQAVSLRGREGGATAELGGDISNCLRASSGGGDKPHVLAAMSVRRITPTECEKLQGFPPWYTMIPWKAYQAWAKKREKSADGKSFEQWLIETTGRGLRQPTIQDCPDGPRYKALGNSMAVPVMRHIGKKIDAALSFAAHSGSISEPELTNQDQQGAV